MNEQGESKGINLLNKVFSIFWEPSKTFSGLSEKTSWIDVVVPILLIVIVSWVTIPYLSPIGIEMAKERIEQSERMNETQKEQALERVENQSPVISYVMAPVSSFIMVLLVALVMWLAGNFFLAGDRKFLPVFAMSAYAFLINIPQTIIKTPLMVSQGTTKVYTGLATFFPESKTFLFRLAARVDVFTIWKVILLGIGLGILYKSEKSKAITTVLIIWFVYAIAASAISGLSPF